MTRDDIIRLAREVDAEIDAYINYHYDEEVVVFYKDQLERFSDLVSAPLKEEIQNLKCQLKEARNE